MKFPLGTIGLVGNGQPPRHKLRAHPYNAGWHVEIYQDGLIVDAFRGYVLNEVLESVAREYPDVQFNPEEA